MELTGLDGLDSLDNIDDLSDESLMNILNGLADDVDTDAVDDNMCISCNEDTLVNDDINGIKVCKNCGQVNNSIMDHKPEWRDYDDGKASTNRCSMPINPFLQQSSLGTSIAGPMIGNVKRLHSWSMMPYKERSLNNVLKDIQHRCRQAHILKCIEDDAKIFYKKISECKHSTGKNEGKFIIIRGKHRKSLIAACIFFACKKNKKSRSAKEIADMFDLNYRDVTKGCKTFWRLINLRNIQLSINSSSPEDYVYRFCTELKIGKEYIDFAQKIARNVKKLSIASTHTAISIATASILLTIYMKDLTITKKHIADKFKVSEVTITKTYKCIEKYREILIDDSKTERILNKLHKERDDIKMPKHLVEKYKKFQKQYIKKDGDYTETVNIGDDLNIYFKNIDSDIQQALSETDDSYKNFNNKVKLMSFV